MLNVRKSKYVDITSNVFKPFSISRFDSIVQSTAYHFIITGFEASYYVT
jgi:hypothetical protein